MAREVVSEGGREERRLIVKWIWYVGDFSSVVYEPVLDAGRIV